MGKKKRTEKPKGPDINISKYASRIPIANIHATVIAIFVAFFSAYLIFVYGKLDDFENSIYEEAYKINYLEIPSIFATGSKEQRYELITKEGSNKVNKKLNSLKDALDELPQHDKVHLGQELEVLMSALSYSYPFRPIAEVTPDGNYRFRPEPLKRLSFDNVYQIQKWIEDMTTLGYRWKWFWSGRESKILACLESHIERRKSVTPEDFISIKKLAAITNDNINTGFRIASDAAWRLEVWKDYHSRQTNRVPIVWILVLFFVAFLSGVVYPLSKWAFWPRFFYWFPIGLYCVFFLYAIKMAWDLMRFP